jgi:hypothetical protein
MLNDIIISMYKSEWTNTFILYRISQPMTMVALTVSEILNGIKGPMPTIFNLYFKSYFVGHFCCWSQKRSILMNVFYFIWQWYNCGYCWCILWRGYRKDLGWWVCSIVWYSGTFVDTAVVPYWEGRGEI